MGRLQRIFRWANVILILLTLFAYLSPYFHPKAIWPFAVLGLFYPFLLLLNLLFVVFWAAQKRPYALFSLGCILLGWGHFTAFVGLNFTATPPPQTEQIKVLSYNIFGFRNRNEEERKASRRWTEKQILEFYEQYQPDIWCIQEYITVPKYADRFADAITANTPLKYAYQEQGQPLAIFSRYPLRAVRSHYFSNNSNGYQIADIEIEGKKIRVINIHLQSNAVSHLAEEVAHNGQLQEKKTWLQIKGMIGRYRRTAAQRSDQATEIREEMEASPHPMILCGDFNDVPLSYTYHILSKGLSDGFQEKGKGLGTTFLGSLPALRIDYIFSAPEIPSLLYRRLPLDRSDHYPVLNILKAPGH